MIFAHLQSGRFRCEAPGPPLPVARHLASRGIHLVVCPSSDLLRPRPLRVTLPPPSAAWLPHQPTRSAFVVSHHPDGFLRVRTPGLVASRYRKGFAAFLCSRAPLQSTRRSLVRCARGFPACAFTPLEEVPPPAAAPHRCGRCPLVVGPSLPTVAGAPRRPSTSRPCSAVGSVATAAVASFGRPLLPWASFPSRVLGGTGFRPDASPHRPVCLVAADPNRCCHRPVPPASFARPTAGVTDAVDRDIPSTDWCAAVASDALRLEVCPRQPVRDPSGAPSSRSSPWAGPRPRTLLGLLTSKNVGTALRRGPNQPLGRFTGGLPDVVMVLCRTRANSQRTVKRQELSHRRRKWLSRSPSGPTGPSGTGS